MVIKSPRGIHISQSLRPGISWQYEAKTDLIKVAYFHSCFCRMMGSAEGSHTSHAKAVHPILNRAGYQYIHPEGVEGMCHGEYPILCETSPCVQ